MSNNRYERCVATYDDAVAYGKPRGIIVTNPSDGVYVLRIPQHGWVYQVWPMKHKSAGRVDGRFAPDIGVKQKGQWTLLQLVQELSTYVNVHQTAPAAPTSSSQTVAVDWDGQIEMKTVSDKWYPFDVIYLADNHVYGVWHYGNNPEPSMFYLKECEFRNMPPDKASGWVIVYQTNDGAILARYERGHRNVESLRKALKANGSRVVYQQYIQMSLAMDLI